MGSANAEKMRGERGHFMGTEFSNGRIVMEIGEDYAVMKDARNGNILVERIYPDVQVREGKEWVSLKFRNDLRVNEHKGWHSVAILMEHDGNLSVRGYLQYAQRDAFRRYAPLYPSMRLWFSESVEYRVIWRYEGVHIRNFEVIDNGTGYTRAPYLHGHGRIVLYNGTVNKRMVFERDEDILLGWNDGYKEFGLNWEWCKERVNRLVIDGEGEEVNIEIESEPEYSVLGNGDPPYPIPDSGTGSGKDSDGDGLYDAIEEGGWDVTWYDATGQRHTEHVTSDPNNPDTDGDGLGDYYEWLYALNPRNEDTDGDGMSDYYEVYYGEPAGGWQEPNYYNARYAVIIVGGGYLDPHQADYDTYLPAFWNDGKAMYDKLVNDYHYSPADVYLMSSRWYVSGEGWKGHDTTTDAIVDGEAMWNVLGKFDIKDALDDIASKITMHDSLFITIIAHGGYYNETRGFFMVRSGVSDSEAENNPSSQRAEINCDYSYNENLGEYLNLHFGGNNGIPRKYAVMTIVLQTCDSQSMMYNLEGDRRIVIAAAKWDEEAWTEVGGDAHWAFLYEGHCIVMLNEWNIWKDEKYSGFILSLGSINSPHPLKYAFDKGYYAARHNYLSELGGLFYKDGRSTPQLKYKECDPDEIYL